MSTKDFDGQYYEVVAPGSLSEKFLAFARDRIYADFLRALRAERFGHHSRRRCFGRRRRRRQRHRAPLPCAGQNHGCRLGTGNAFKVSFPQIQYRQILANQALPFADASFDIVTANAVLEHVGSAENQRFLISATICVGGRVYITVPHRFFPVEHHTAIPLLHWFDATFPVVCRVLGKEKWAASENLILCRGGDLKTPPLGIRRSKSA